MPPLKLVSLRSPVTYLLKPCGHSSASPYSMWQLAVRPSPSFLKLMPGSKSLLGFPWASLATPFQSSLWTPVVTFWSLFTVYTLSLGNLTISIVLIITYVLTTPESIFSNSTYILGSKLHISNYWTFSPEYTALSDMELPPTRVPPFWVNSTIPFFLPTEPAMSLYSSSTEPTAHQGLCFLLFK